MKSVPFSTQSQFENASITFLGFNITTAGGVQAYKLIISLLPLVPIIVLLAQNAIYVNDLVENQSSISATESQVTKFYLLVRRMYTCYICFTHNLIHLFNVYIFQVANVANLAGFTSKIQNERLALIFANSPSIKQFKTKEGKR